MKSRILAAVAAMLFSFPLRAAEISYFDKVQQNASAAWNSDNYDLYVPIWTWHNRWFYDKEHLDRYNEEPWGIGLGKSHYDEEGNWHALYAMGFKDSNRYLQTIFGYAFQKNWFLNCNRDIRVGLGYTLSLTQRQEYAYIPVPLPLPLAGIEYHDFALQAAYVPGVKNNGNVLFAWMRWAINN